MVYPRDPLKGVGMGCCSKRNPEFKKIVWRRQRELVEAITGKKFTISCVCRNTTCAHSYTEWEIVNWFDVDGFTVECPKCGWHSEPRLTVDFGDGGNRKRIECQLYGPGLVLERLPVVLKSPPWDFAEYSAICNSAVVHFGGLKQACAQLGIERSFGPGPDWRDRIDPFLGRLPDTVMARLLDTSPRFMRRWRRNQRIAPFDPGRVLLSGKEVRTV